MNNSDGQQQQTEQQVDPFAVRDCALVALATGLKAQNLREFLHGIQTCDRESIYYHFWGRLLRPRFDEPEYINDFAAWAHRALDEKALAERLSVVNPADYPDIESLRQELVEIIEDRLDADSYVPWSQADNQFYFISSQIVIFETGVQASTPRELAKLVPAMSAGTIFYHFIDARRRTPDRRDDFTQWLSGYDGRYAELISEIQAVDPYFSSLLELRGIIGSLFLRYLIRMK